MLYGNCNKDEYECDGATKWLPRRCCKKHALKDSRTPGLFKLEFSGDIFIGLCLKLYVVGNREKDITKHSSKGISKPGMKEICEQLNMSVVDVYLGILNEGRNLSASNKCLIALLCHTPKNEMVFVIFIQSMLYKIMA